ncbi:MAG: hypothetical protein JSV12_04335 [Candidatus Bathyarchaeota archaeon]|nr:MAG: hypothetical protein JSV12_04335 [Candidatus Bathyarchaeota archaeon]
MRRFADLHLQPSVKDSDQLNHMVSRASELGYRLVGITLPPNITQEKIRQLQDICKDAGIDLVTRVDLTSKTPNQLLRELRHFRRKFETISVVCTSKAVARQAAKDRRVDLLSFPATSSRRRFFDYAEAELASNALSSLEVDMAPLLSLKSFSRIQLLSSLRKEVAIAKKFGVPVVISSGATNVYLMRGPYEYAALASLFDMAVSFALRALSETPLNIVKRNREKLSPNFIAPGIRIVRRKRNCPDT